MTPKTWPVGLKIVAVRCMTKAEMEKEGWEEGVEWCGPIPVLLLSDGSRLYASRDSEGNGPGMIFGADNKRQYALSV